MWDGAELGPAASVYAPREGSRRRERLWLAECQPGAGVHGETGGDRRQSGAFPLSLLAPRGQTPVLGRGVRFTRDSLLVPRSSTLVPLCCALEALAEFGFTFFSSFLSRKQ